MTADDHRARRLAEQIMNPHLNRTGKTTQDTRKPTMGERRQSPPAQRRTT